MAQSFTDLIPDTMNENAATYWMPKEMEVDGIMTPLVFKIYFIRDANGQWLVDKF